MNLLALLLAKAGAATVTAKVAVAGAVSVAAIGTAGATGVVPVEALLPGDTSVTVQEDADPGAPVEEITPAPDEIEAPEEDDAPEDEAPKDEAPEDGAPDEEAPEDEAPEEDAPEEDAGRSAALEALDAAQSRAPEQADAGLDRARAAVSGTAERGPGAARTAPEQSARPTPAQRPTQGAGRGAGSDDRTQDGQTGSGDAQD